MTTISYGNYSLRSAQNYPAANRYNAGSRNNVGSKSAGYSRSSVFSSLAALDASTALNSFAVLDTSAALRSLAEINSSGILSKIASSAGTASNPGTPWSSLSSKPAGTASETTWLGYTVENDTDTFGDTWEQVDQLPGFYDLKDGKPVGWIEYYPGREFRLYHAAESTDENPVLIARGADEHGKVFEQKITLNEIDPYNATMMEVDALVTVYGPEDRFITIPFPDFSTDKMDTRFDYINSLQEAITCSRRLGFIREARNYQKNIDFLLNATKSRTASSMSAGTGTVDAKKNLELSVKAARERFLSNMAQKYSNKKLSDQLLDTALFD